jgi:hypothetical protein
MEEESPVPNKAMLFIGLFAFALMGCALFIAWRLQRLKVQREDADKRAAVAFEEMNRLTKQLRDRGRATPADTSVPPGKRLQAMYPGPKPGNAGPARG